MNPRTIFAIAITTILLVALLLTSGSIFENVDAHQIVVIQAPISGKLVWYTQPGVVFQGFGKVTAYEKRSQFWFSAKDDQGEQKDESIKVRFNDGGHAMLSGGISWEMPLDDEHLTTIHFKFGSQHAVEQQLVRTAVEKSIYMTGPMMSSTESYASRRNELLSLIEDQIANGVYLTITTMRESNDPITNEKKMVAVVELAKDKEGTYKRAEESPLKTFGVKTFNLSINEVKYDETVEKQISQQQQATMQVQIAIAEAKKAEQQALTTKKEGEAEAAKAEWAQKAIAAKATTEATMKKDVAETEAQQKLAVAKLEAEAAEQKKQAEIALGEGESKRRQMVMEADGALEKKLEAFVQVNEAYADAISRYQGNWVPSIVMAGGGPNGNAAQATDLIQLLLAKTAKDLSLDMSVIQNSKPKAAPAPAPVQ